MIGEHHTNATGEKSKRAVMQARTAAAVAGLGWLANLRIRKLASQLSPNVVAASALALSQHTIWALDFDGVLCDSARETGTSAWKCCQRLWPNECDRWSASIPVARIIEVSLPSIFSLSKLIFVPNPLAIL